MIVYLPNKTQFRDDDPKERGQLARRSLRRRLGLAHSYKVNSSAPSALLGDLPARYSPQDGGGCAFDPARRQSPFRGTSSRHAGLLSMSFHSIALRFKTLFFVITAASPMAHGASSANRQTDQGMARRSLSRAGISRNQPSFSVNFCTLTPFSPPQKTIE